MKVPKELDLAARVLITMASKPPKTATTLDEFVESVGGSRSTLVRILSRLKKAELVRYRRRMGREELFLKRPPSEIHLGMVVQAVDANSGWLLALHRKQDEPTEPGVSCLPAWREVEKAMIEALESYTLDHLVWDSTFYL